MGKAIRSLVWVAVLALVFPGAGWGEGLSGVKVVDQSTGQAVAGATVVLDGSILAADEEGLFPITKGGGRLRVKAPGYHRVEQALEWVGLAEKAQSRPAQLSGGECQRVSIARAMVKRPQLVLADEPSANLDADNSHHILRTMKRLNRELGTTFIFATHDEKVISYVHRKIHLIDGKVAADERVAVNTEGGVNFDGN